MPAARPRLMSDTARRAARRNQAGGDEHRTNCEARGQLDFGHLRKEPNYIRYLAELQISAKLLI
jgi:hypothetical protein